MSAWTFLVGNFVHSDEDLTVFNQAMAEVQKTERLKAVARLRKQAETYEELGHAAGARFLWHAIQLVAQEGDEA